MNLQIIHAAMDKIQIRPQGFHPNSIMSTGDEKTQLEKKVDNDGAEKLKESPPGHKQ